MQRKEVMVCKKVRTQLMLKIHLMSCVRVWHHQSVYQISCYLDLSSYILCAFWWRNLIMVNVVVCTLLIFKGSQKAYKRQKLCNFHIKDLSFAFSGICLPRKRHLYLLKVIFFKIYRVLPLGGKNVSDLEGIFLKV